MRAEIDTALSVHRSSPDKLGWPSEVLSFATANDLL